MPRRRARSKPEQDIAAVVAAVVAMLVFINWGMPSLWASIKFILFLGIGGVVVIGGIALLVQVGNTSNSKVRLSLDTQSDSVLDTYGAPKVIR